MKLFHLQGINSKKVWYEPCWDFLFVNPCLLYFSTSLHMVLISDLQNTFYVPSLASFAGLALQNKKFFLHLYLYQEPKVGKVLFKKPSVSRKRSLFLLVFYYRMALLSACGTEGLMLLSMLIVFCIAIFLCLDLRPLLKVWFISSGNTWPMTENLVQMWCRTLRHEEDPLLMETKPSLAAGNLLAEEPCSARPV